MEGCDDAPCLAVVDLRRTRLDPWQMGAPCRGAGTMTDCLCAAQRCGGA